MGLVLSIALSAGSRRGLVGKKGLPDMLRTLITLECAEDASFSAIAVDAGAPTLTHPNANHHPHPQPHPIPNPNPNPSR